MDTEIPFVIYNGLRMPKEWPRKIREAQSFTHYTIAGKSYLRVQYEDASRPCHDCSVIAGKLHVPDCDMERCPVYGGQLISCGCRR